MPLAEQQSGPEQPAASPEQEISLRAEALYRAETSQDLPGVVAEKIEELRRYDVEGMDQVSAILSWGRSGSLLLASYIDGHDDVLMLPELCGWLLYQFFDRYPSLPLREKLLAYPLFQPDHTRFFEGDFAISPAQYYAAVQAIVESSDRWSPEFLESRRAFFLFMHIAYTLALGRRPASSRPFIVYAQHVFNNDVAREFVKDFPQAKFVHTVRDPISSCDGIFQQHLQFVENHIHLPCMAILLLTATAGDQPHDGMASRTRTVRFEDMHGDLAETMRGLSDWLGFHYQAALLESTFNGIPYVVARDGKAWSGPRLEQMQRRSINLSAKDRALLFALCYENFEDWNYPCPRIYGNLLVRCSVVLSLFLFPMKMEFVSGRAVFKRLTVPLMRKGQIWRAIKSVLGIGVCRLGMISLLMPAFFRRCAYGVNLLQVARPPELRDQAASAAKSQMKLT